MNTHDNNDRKGDLRWGAAAWLIGLPLPIVILALLFGGCGQTRGENPAQAVPYHAFSR
jgi:hypothetical protein